MCTDYTVYALCTICTGPASIRYYFINSNSRFTELKAMCNKINNKKLKRATLTAQLVKVGCSMLVKNIESEDMDEEYLELYFSNPKLSGGKGVKDVNFIGGGMAVITFEDCKGILYCVIYSICNGFDPKL